MTPTLAFTPRASADIEEAYRWYEAQRPGLGGEFEAALELVLRLARTVPEAGPKVHRELRRLLVPKFPYSLYYRLDESVIEIRGCLHQRREPRVWRRRA